MYISPISLLSVITMDIRPNHSIYINNLNEKVKKEGKQIIYAQPSR